MYICNKCGARLDSGESCSCGGRAVYSTCQAGHAATKSIEKKADPKKKYNQTIKYQIHKTGSDEVIREYTDFKEAFMSCDIDEQVKQVMILPAAN